MGHAWRGRILTTDEGVFFSSSISEMYTVWFCDFSIPSWYRGVDKEPTSWTVSRAQSCGELWERHVPRHRFKYPFFIPSSRLFAIIVLHAFMLSRPVCATVGKCAMMQIYDLIFQLMMFSVYNTYIIHRELKRKLISPSDCTKFRIFEIDCRYYEKSNQSFSLFFVLNQRNVVCVIILHKLNCIMDNLVKHIIVYCMLHSRSCNSFPWL